MATACDVLGPNRCGVHGLLIEPPRRGWLWVDATALSADAVTLPPNRKLHRLHRPGESAGELRRPLAGDAAALGGTGCSAQIVDVRFEGLRQLVRSAAVADKTISSRGMQLSARDYARLAGPCASLAVWSVRTPCGLHWLLPPSGQSPCAQRTRRCPGKQQTARPTPGRPHFRYAHRMGSQLPDLRAQPWLSSTAKLAWALLGLAM